LSEVIAFASLSFEAQRAVHIWNELKVTFTAEMLWLKRYSTLLTDGCVNERG
jgi:hypothetical protein